jgi:hypothetical protein
MRRSTPGHNRRDTWRHGFARWFHPSRPYIFVLSTGRKEMKAGSSAVAIAVFPPSAADPLARVGVVSLRHRGGAIDLALSWWTRSGEPQLTVGR